MKTKKSFVKFVSAFVMALMLCVSFGVCSGFTVKADTRAEVNPLAEQDTYTVQIQPRAVDPGSPYTPNRCYNRLSQYTITDAGPMANPCDVVYYFSYSDYTKGQLIDANFKTMTVQLRLEFWQKDHGYQWFYLYRGDTKIAEQNYINDYSETPVWHTVVFTNIRIQDFDDTVTIRYDGSGKGDDTWFNRNLTVTFTYYK